MSITPTEEQNLIVRAVATGETLKVSALAGTGKTSTLQLIAEAYPKKKGLYLAYNKGLQLDAKRKFPPWITCKTVHGLAFGKTGGQFLEQLNVRPDYGCIIEELNIEPVEVFINIGMDSLKIEISPPKMLEMAREMIRYFSFSDKSTLEEENFEHYIKTEILEKYPELLGESEETENRQDVLNAIFVELGHRLLRLCKEIWGLQISPDSETVPATHDTYLKLYQLRKPLIDCFDYIMLDEAQDANPCILDILKNQTCQVIYVGDEHQQIYAYRGTVNAMQHIDAQTLYLTQSFRFGQEIADEANEVLRQLKSPVTVKGFEPVKSKVKKIKTPPYTVLARTNLTLFNRCIEAILDDYTCCLLGDVYKILSLYRSIFYLWMKKPTWITDDRVRGFETWKECLEFAKAEDDVELLSAINFIRTHGEKSLNLLKIIEKSKKVPEQSADIIFSTAHKAKGREWDKVIIAEDFGCKTVEELNIYYVAITRAKHVLHIINPQKPATE